MSVRTTTDHALNVVLTLLVLPARAVEEGLHVIGALPWATQVRVEVDPRAGTAETVVSYPETTPRWAIRFSYVLPELVGWAAGIAVLAYWLLAGALWLPASLLDWVLLSLLGAQWLAVALPSAADADQTPEGEHA